MNVIRDEVVLKLKDKRLAVFSAYIPMVMGDSADPAAVAGKEMAKHGIKSFWDGKHELGKAYAGVVKLPPGHHVAWDIYFIYGPNAVWGKTPPEPVYWMHQLGIDERCLDGTKFRAAVAKELKALKPKVKLTFLTRDGCVNSPKMRANLNEALKKLGWTGAYDIIDIGTLPVNDGRRGYSTPTVLLNGNDLFGLPPPRPGSSTEG